VDQILLRLKDTFDASTLEGLGGSSSLWGGLLVGVLLGIILQKGRLCKYDVVSGMFRMQDFTFWRIGTPLLMIAMTLIFFFKDLGVLQLYLPRTVPLQQLVGGLMFGAGLAILGYCPAIAAGALGEGRMDALPGMFGMVGGVLLYAEFFHESALDKMLGYIDMGRVTFPDVFLVFNHWFFVSGFVVMCVMFLIGITIYDGFLKTSFSAIERVKKALR
jgi:hypothetical protein